MLTAERGTRLEHLGWQECLRLLATHPVGRVVVTMNGWPTIFPVNHHVVDSDTIVFRSDELLKLTDATSGLRMSLETDGIDDAGQLWSVTVNGVGREIVDAWELERLRELGLEPYGPGPETHWLRIRPESITGRRLPGSNGPRDEATRGGERRT
jgi:uncharacterized protein